MNEPLKGKTKDWIANGRQHTIEKIKEDVKSAAEGLYEEIRTLDNETMHPSRKILACRIIRKWFPDAKDNDTKERL